MESVPLVDCAGRPRSPATLPGYHHGRRPATKRCAIRLTRHRSRRLSPSCAPPGMTPTVSGTSTRKRWLSVRASSASTKLSKLSHLPPATL